MQFTTLINSKGYKQEVIFQDNEETPKEPRFKIVGKLKKTERKQFTMNTSRSGSNKPVYKDEANQEFIKTRGFWWKFPEQLEY